MVTGGDLLKRLDTDIQRMRTRRNDAAAHLAATQKDQAHARDAQLNVHERIAQIRVDFIQSAGSANGFDAAHRKAKALLDQHDTLVAQAAKEMTEQADQLTQRETDRAQFAAAHEQATSAYDEKVNDVEAALTQDVAYQELYTEHEKSAAIVTRAALKLAVASEDRTAKGEPYDTDPLFSYLWKRKFRFPTYKAAPFSRYLDGWVAGICKYDLAYLNYQRLTDLPMRLGEHLETVDAAANVRLEALEDAEERALEQAGAVTLRQKAEQLLMQIKQTDQAIEAGENSLHELTTSHDAIFNEETGPAIQAQDLLEAHLSEASMPSLRVMAAQTIGREDDRLIAELAHLRIDEDDLLQTARSAEQRMKNLKRELKQSEQCRRRLKKDRLDSPYVVYQDSLVDDVLMGLNQGRFDGREAADKFRRAAKRSGQRRSTEFGGRRRTRSMGVPEVLGDIMWEVAREALRQSSRSGSGGYRGHRSRRGPTIRMPRTRSRPRSPRRSGGGGFKTGGGF